MIMIICCGNCHIIARVVAVLLFFFFSLPCKCILEAKGFLYALTFSFQRWTVCLWNTKPIYICERTLNTFTIVLGLVWEGCWGRRAWVGSLLPGAAVPASLCCAMDAYRTLLLTILFLLYIDTVCTGHKAIRDTLQTYTFNTRYTLPSLFLHVVR